MLENKILDLEKAASQQLGNKTPQELVDMYYKGDET
jgi:hypothetical protein